MKRSQPKRDWTDARAKVEREGRCRFWTSGNCRGPLEAAHVIGRECDKKDGYLVLPSRVVPLCKTHHDLYDAHRLDLLPALELEEQIQATLDSDGLERARVRTAPLAYRSAA